MLGNRPGSDEWTVQRHSRESLAALHDQHSDSLENALASSLADAEDGSEGKGGDRDGEEVNSSALVRLSQLLIQNW